VETISLEVRESNLAAQYLYREHGFAPVGRRRQYYTDNGEDALIMVMAWTIPPEEEEAS
jgi:ribosomal-protein-alanine N-acetyltransferase